MKETRQPNSFLACLEAAACVGIVFLHCADYPGAAGDIVNLGSRFAVPLFYLVSGYYLFEQQTDLQQKISRVRRKLLHIMRLTIVATLLYLVHQMASRRLLEGASFKGMLMEYFNLRELTMWALFNRVPFAGHLWFLYGLLYAYFLVYWLVRFGHKELTKTAKWLPIALVILGILLRFAAYFSPQMVWYFSVADVAFYRNWIFESVPFVLLGCQLRRCPCILKARSSLWVALALCGIVAMVLEWRLYLHLFHTYPELYLGTVLETIALFLLAIQNPTVGQNSRLARFGLQLTMPIYVVHVMISWLLGSIYTAMGGNTGSPVFYWGRPIVVLLISAGVSNVYLYILRKSSAIYKH